jgi:hypothetical protein
MGTARRNATGPLLEGRRNNCKWALWPCRVPLNHAAPAVSGGRRVRGAAGLGAGESRRGAPRNTGGGAAAGDTAGRPPLMGRTGGGSVRGGAECAQLRC